MGISTGDDERRIVDAAIAAVALLGVALFVYGTVGLLGIGGLPTTGGEVALPGAGGGTTTAAPTTTAPSTSTATARERTTTTPAEDPSTTTTTATRAESTTARADRGDPGPTDRLRLANLRTERTENGGRAVRGDVVIGWNATADVETTAVVVSARVENGSWQRVHESNYETLGDGRRQLRLNGVTLLSNVSNGSSADSGVVVLVVRGRTPNGTTLLVLTTERFSLSAEPSLRTGRIAREAAETDR